MVIFFLHEMIKYAVKRCESFGFAINIDKAKELFPNNIDDLVIIDEDNPIPSPKDFSDKHATFFVVLGRKTIVDLQELEKNEEDLTYLKNLSKTDIKHAEEIAACIELYKNRSFFDGKDFTGDFCDFLVNLYPHLKDSSFKKTIFRVLKDEHIASLDDLATNYPLKYITVKNETVVNTKPFDDVKILTSKDDSGISSTVYKNRAEDIQKSLLGNSTYLEAMTKGVFTVVKGKRSAGFNYENRLLNHDTLDLIARNGIMCSPEDMKNGSFVKLMNVFEACKSFNVIFIHPSLTSKAIRVEHPCEPALPEYIVREGEILAIAFRYIVMYFFGYKGVYDDALKEYEYLF